MTRDEFIATHGYDPAPKVKAHVGLSPDDEGGGVVDHLKSGVVGIATLPTDVIALPGVVGSGVAGLYRSYRDDTKFLDEFRKSQQIEGAQLNTQKHLQEIMQHWKNENPSLTDDDINKGIEEYTKTKQYEDFSRQQLSGAQWLAAEAKDTVRSLLGDERPDSKRSWTESAAEIGASSLIGGPAGWVAKAGAVPSLAGIVANPVARGAIRTAEAVTPLTIPYSGANVAINAAAGIGIDQAVRWAEGKPFAFGNQTPDDTSGVGALAATGAGIAGMAAFVGAVRGRAHLRLQAAQQTPTAQALEAEMRVNDRVSDPMRTGEASIIAGPESQHEPPASLDTMSNKPKSLWRRIKNQYIDQDNVSISNIRDEHGAKVADELEGVVNDNTGNVLNDNKRNGAELLTRPMRMVLANMPADTRRALKTGAQMSSYKADWDEVYQQNMADIQELQLKIANAQTPQARGAHTASLQQKMNDLQRLVNDDPDARLRLPELNQGEVRRIAAAFEADTSPHAMAFKRELRIWSNHMLDMQVSAGKMTQQQADNLRIRNPYYIPTIEDPLKGARGIDRVLKSISNSVKNAMTTTSKGTSGMVMRETPIERLNTIIPQPNAQRETRVTAQLDAQSAILMYTERNFVDTAHTMMRNEFNAHHMWKDPTTKQVPTSLQRNGNVVQNHEPGTGRTWFGVHEQMSNDWVKGQFDNPRVVPTWEGGRVSFHEYGDVEIARMLRAEPVLMNGLMRAASAAAQTMKYWTTGHGNPVFALKGAAYDVMVGMVTRAPGRAFGPMSAAAYRFLPEGVARHTAGRILDISAPIFAPLHSIKALADVMAAYSTRWTAEQLKNTDSAFGALASAMGPAAYNAMLKGAIKLAHVADMSHTMELLRRGAARGSGAINDVAKIRDAFTMVRDNIPSPAKAAYQFYTDLIDSVYLGPKRMFYTENYGLLYRKHNGQIPTKEINKLIHETRTLGGDMTKMPASHTMRQLEATIPYLTQSKLGAYHLYRNMASPQTMSYVLPRVAQLMLGAGATFWWRTYWNEESRKEFWNKPEHERWRYISVPSPTLLLAWAKGEDPPYNRNLYYELPMPPDFTGLVAGAGAVMQATGAIPASATPTPIVSDLPMTFLDSLMPAMPPALQMVLAQSGMRIDPQTADIRGGNWIRSFQPAFKAGPSAESATNLGQVSTSTSLMWNALFGVMGTNLAQGTDIMLHAAKFHPTVTGGSLPTPRETKDFGLGLRLATTEVLKRSVKSVPDVYGASLLWQGKEKYSSMTPAWKFTTQATGHIRSIVGMKDELAKAATQARENANQVGGIPKPALTDPLMAAIAVDVSQYYNPSGRLGKLRKEYGDLVKANQSLVVNYNLPSDERQRRSNVMIQTMQHNMQQQYLSIKYLEQELAKKYGQALAPRLQGRGISVQSLDQMLRENTGGATTPEVAQAE